MPALLALRRRRPRRASRLLEALMSRWDQEFNYPLHRALAFIVVQVALAVLGIFGALAPFICLPIVVVLEELSDRLRPPAPIDPATDLRAFYRVTT